MRTTAEKMRIVEVMRRNTLQRLRNFWYRVDLLFQVPKDIILEPRTRGMLTALFVYCCHKIFLSASRKYLNQSLKMAAWALDWPEPSPIVTALWKVSYSGVVCCLLVVTQVDHSSIKQLVVACGHCNIGVPWLSYKHDNRQTTVIHCCNDNTTDIVHFLLTLTFISHLHDVVIFSLSPLYLNQC